MKKYLLILAAFIVCSTVNVHAQAWMSGLVGCGGSPRDFAIGDGKQCYHIGWPKGTIAKFSAGSSQKVTIPIISQHNTLSRLGEKIADLGNLIVYIDPVAGEVVAENKSSKRIDLTIKVPLSPTNHYSFNFDVSPNSTVRKPFKGVPESSWKGKNMTFKRIHIDGIH